MDRRDALALLGEPETEAEGLAWLEGRARALPDSVRAAFDLAGAYDTLGRETEAAPAYERVLHLGLQNLTEADQARWHVQYGSTLRVIGRIEESRAVLTSGVMLFSQDAALPVFLAFTELTAGHPEAALSALLAGAAASDPFGSRTYYRRAITAYAAELTPPAG